MIFFFTSGMIKGGMRGIGFEKKMKIEAEIEDDSVKFKVEIF